MKNTLIYLLSIAWIFSSCGHHSEHADDHAADTTAVQPSNTGSFGEAITEDGAVSANELAQKAGDADTFTVKLTGTITDVCQKKGCWMMIDIGGGKELRVTFRDYGFFVPKDCAGKTAVFDGFAYRDTISVEALQHYAEESGKSETEIAAITEPEIALAFEAKGVIIK